MPSTTSAGSRPSSGTVWALRILGVLLALAAAFGLVTVGIAQITNVGLEPGVIKCGDRVMKQGDTCWRKTRTSSGTYTYDQMVRQQDDLLARNRGWTSFGSGLAAVTGPLAVLLFVLGAALRRRDGAAAQPPSVDQVAQLTQQHDLGPHERSYQNGVKQSVNCHRGGLIVTGRRGPTAIVWSAVDEVRAEEWVGMQNGEVMHCSYQLTGRGFDPVTIDPSTVPDTAQLVELGGHLQQLVAAAQLPAALRRLSAGQPIAFGPKITVDRNGLVITGQRVPWSTVHVCRTTKVNNMAFPVPGTGEVTIRQKDIVNLGLLRLLAQQAAPA